MTWWDNKYGIVETQYGNDEEDEIVVVFRGRDRHLPQLLDLYHDLCEDDSEPSPNGHLDLIMETRREVVLWQEENAGSVRTPTSDAYFERTAPQGE